MPTATTPDDADDTADGLDVEELLDQAVATLGGTRRDGQHQMALAVSDAMANGRHLLV